MKGGEQVLGLRPIPTSSIIDKPANHTDTSPSVLISAPYMMPHIGRFTRVIQAFGLNVIVADVKERLSEGDLLKIFSEKNFEAIICGDDRFTEKVYELCKGKLKVVSKWGTGIDSLNPDIALKHGAVVTNTPGAFTAPVSDSCVAYMLAFARKFVSLDKNMKNKMWEKISGHTIGEKTVGIIGVGEIGKAVMKKIRGLGGSRLLCCDIVTVDQQFLDEVDAKQVELNTLLGDSDYICINCDLNPTSEHLINMDSIMRVKHGAYLINCARGPICSEKALVYGLERGILAGCALDVFEVEPLPLDSKLFEYGDRVFLAPHNCNQSPLAHERVHWNAIRNVVKVLNVKYEDIMVRVDADSYSDMQYVADNGRDHMEKSRRRWWVLTSIVGVFLPVGLAWACKD